MIRNFARQVGKSTAIAKRLKSKEKIVVVCFSENSRSNFITSAKLTKEQASKVITSHKLFRRDYRKEHDEKYIFDELTACLDILGEWESYGTERIKNDEGSLKFAEEYEAKFIEDRDK